jgi:hypothetical protein
MAWGGLNAALTAWRNAYVALLPKRRTESDGARADALHGSTSQHQEDADGTVDANDMDVNVLGSSDPDGTDLELSVIEAMKTDFERDPYGRGQLWIHDREIANRDVDDWSERYYSGDNPHDKHVHWQSRQSKEHISAPWPMPATTARLREMGEIVDQADIDKIVNAVVAKIGPKLDAAASAWDDAYGRGDNRRTTLDYVQETRDMVQKIAAVVVPPETPPADV